MTVLFLDKRKDQRAVMVCFVAWDVEQWAEHPGYGNLSHESAHAFSRWVEDVHADGEYEHTLTVGELLRRCLERWIGGRPI